MSYLQTEKYNFTDFAPEVWLYAQTCTHTHKHKPTQILFMQMVCMHFLLTDVFQSATCSEFKDISMCVYVSQ